jgi:hypothetical protein
MLKYIFLGIAHPVFYRTFAPRKVAETSGMMPGVGIIFGKK